MVAGSFLAVVIRDADKEAANSGRMGWQRGSTTTRSR